MNFSRKFTPIRERPDFNGKSCSLHQFRIHYKHIIFFFQIFIQKVMKNLSIYYQHWNDIYFFNYIYFFNKTRLMAFAAESLHIFLKACHFSFNKSRAANIPERKSDMRILKEQTLIFTLPSPFETTIDNWRTLRCSSGASFALTARFLHLHIANVPRMQISICARFKRTPHASFSISVPLHFQWLCK